MMFITHLAFGFLVALLTITLIEVPNQSIFILAVIFGAALADLDKMSSRLGSKIKPLSFLLELLFGHRGLMHTIYIPIAMFVTISLFGYPVIGFAFLIGFISHLLIDSLTTTGISFLRPFNNLHLKGFIKTGGILEYALLATILVFIAITINNVL